MTGAAAAAVAGRRGALLLVLLLAACSAGSSSTPLATPTPAASVSSSTPPNDLPSEDPALEALLPDEIGGEATEKLSMRGDGLVAAGSSDPTFAAFIERLDARPEDVGVAYAYTLESEVQAFAYQVAGAAPDRLLDELQASVQAQDEASDVTWSDASVGGKDVRVGQAAQSTDASIYLYGSGDVVFIIVTDDAALAAEVAAGLP